MAMVESYDSEAALRNAYGERISLIEASLKTSQLDETNLRNSLVSLLGQAGDLELSGKPVPPALVANLRTQHAQLAQLLRIAEQQRQDRKALDGQLNDAVARYRVLKHPANADRTGGGRTGTAAGLTRAGRAGPAHSQRAAGAPLRESRYGNLRTATPGPA